MSNTIDLIYQASRQGLDILLDLYPDARECVEGTKKKFRIREGDRTPSASIRKKATRHGELWMVTDFGGDGREHSPLDAYMAEHGIRQEYVKEAILQLAARYGVTEQLSAEANKPDVEQRPAAVDEMDGKWYLRFEETMNDDDLRLFGPRVTQEHCDLLHWKKVASITYVKNRQATVVKANDTYPIYARECEVGDGAAPDGTKVFYKIYQPKSFDKARRFTYYPGGVMPRGYVHGLAELKRRYREYNAQEEAEAKKVNPDASYREQRLPEAVICSGERDAMCAMSQGYFPLWRNSETVPLDEATYRDIMRHVNTLYNIPDLDETGIRKGRELALQYPDIRTAWLDPWLANYTDNRAHRRKDLRDWMDLRPRRQDFRDLLQTALPCRWWYETDKGMKMDTACLLHFLKCNGYGVLKDDVAGTMKFIRVTGYKVTEVTPRDIKEFLKTWVVDHHEHRDVLNLVLNSQKLSASTLEGMDTVAVDFKNYAADRQVFFFDNCNIEVSAQAITEYQDRGGSLGCKVWTGDVVPRRFSSRGVGPFFRIASGDDGDFDIHILDTRSHFFGYLINSSRLHWRKEMERRFTDAAERQAYANANRFRIDGEGLSPGEIREQKMSLINKIFTFGYMLHRYKSQSRAWAPMAMDYKIGENDQCNGRSGKSFFFKVLAKMMPTVVLSGRNPKLMDNPHVFDRVTKFTDMLLVDDCDRFLGTGQFYDNITGDMTVNPKNNQSYSIAFEDSPKLAFTTNYVPADFDPSSEARLLYMVFSDYYHQRTQENDYLESRSIRDDFGKDLYGYDYTDEEWNLDLNFFAQCCQFYLQHSREKMQPPMANIITRKLKADMGESFEEWATGYFSEESGRLDQELEKQQVVDDLKREVPILAKMTPQKFQQKLAAFVALCPYIDELNPKELCNSSGRIQRKRMVGDMARTMDMLYLRSAKEAAKGSIAVPDEEKDDAKGDTPF